jgi:hypothetical protein
VGRLLVDGFNDYALHTQVWVIRAEGGQGQQRRATTASELGKGERGKE